MRTHSWAVWACALAFGPISGASTGANLVAPYPPQQEVKEATEALQVASTPSGGMACTNCHGANAAQDVARVQVVNRLYQQDANGLATAVRFYVEPNREDEILGATLTPVNEALRAQLDLIEGQGLLVEAIADGGAAAKAGLQKYDILLSLNDQPLPTREAFQEKLRASGDKALRLGLVRGRQRTTLNARPVTWVTLGPAADQATHREYFIGVSLDPVDEALRTNLGLKEGEGVLIKEIVADSPAAKAGVKAYDIALKLADQPVESVEGFRVQIQKLGESEAALSGLRGGKPFTLKIKPAVRTGPEVNSESVKYLSSIDRLNADATFVVGTRQAAACPAAHSTTWLGAWNASQQDWAQKLGIASVPAENDGLRQELRSLREAIERLEKAMNAKK